MAICQILKEGQVRKHILQEVLELSFIDLGYTNRTLIPNSIFSIPPLNQTESRHRVLSFFLMLSGFLGYVHILLMVST